MESKCTIDKYIEKYRELCADWNEETTKSGVRKYNRTQDKLSKLNNEIRTLEKEKISKLMKILLADDNSNVKAAACCFCLKEHIHYEEALAFFDIVLANRDKYSWRVHGIAFHCRFCVDNGML